MGALGILYGTHIAKRIGFDRVHYVMDEKRCEKYEGSPVFCNGEELHFSCVTPSRAEPADLLIIAVKSTGLADALDVMESSVGEDTVIISVLNGISSEEVIAERFGREHLIFTVAQGMDAMKFGEKLTYSKMGILVIGIQEELQRPNLERVCEFFERTRLPYQTEADIRHRLWGKFMLNVGVNQTCMVFSGTYKDVWREGRERDTMLNAMREVIAVGNAEGVNLTEADLQEYDSLIKTLAPDGMPSMAQDRIAKRHSEVDMFAGTIIAYGKKHGIPTPVNEWLYEQVQEIEDAY